MGEWFAERPRPYDPNGPEALTPCTPKTKIEAKNRPQTRELVGVVCVALFGFFLGSRPQALFARSTSQNRQFAAWSAAHTAVQNYCHPRSSGHREKVTSTRTSANGNAER